MAVSEFVPSGNVPVVRVAIPFVSVPVPSEVVPLKNCTVPVATPDPGLTAATVADNRNRARRRRWFATRTNSS